MPRHKSFLTKRAKEALILFVALNGENRERYEAYCNQTGIPRFTPYYYRTWIHRNRAEIQRQRLMHMVELKAQSALDRQKRMSMLEDNARVLGERIQDLLNHPERMDLRLLATVMEQQRKLLEAVARERGEWGMKDEGPTDLERLHETLIKQMTVAIEATPPLLEEGAVEGEFHEVPSGS